MAQTAKHQSIEQPHQIFGFTLIEILVVLLIISIVTATTIIAVGDGGRSRKIKAAAEELYTAIALAQSQAILTQSVIGLQFTENTYSFLIFNDTVNKADKQLSFTWSPLINNSILTKHTLPSFIKLQISVENVPLQQIQQFAANTTPFKPQAIILPSGSFTPFKISSSNGKNSFIITGNSSGNLSLHFGEKK